VVGEYVRNFGPRVVGFTGEAAGVAAAAAAFGVFYEKMPPMPDGDYMVNHTASLFLLGEGDEILETIPYGAPPADIAAAVRRHL
jgi:protein SCO1/2